MRTNWTRRLTRLSALLLVSGIVVLSAVVLLRTAPNLGGSDARAFTADDVERSGLTVREVESAEGLLSREEVLVLARTNYDPPDPNVRIDVFLVRATDSESLGTAIVIDDRPVWIVRYSNLNQHFRNGTPMNYLYDLYDAQSGEFLVGVTRS
jgi:hypothetical protein